MESTARSGRGLNVCADRDIGDADDGEVEFRSGVSARDATRGARDSFSDDDVAFLSGWGSTGHG